MLLSERLRIQFRNGVWHLFDLHRWEVRRSFGLRRDAEEALKS